MGFDLGVGVKLDTYCSVSIYGTAGWLQEEEKVADWSQ
jgi:hypothetical protein